MRPRAELRVLPKTKPDSSLVFVSLLGFPCHMSYRQCNGYESQIWPDLKGM